MFVRQPTIRRRRQLTPNLPFNRLLHHRVQHITNFFRWLTGNLKQRVRPNGRLRADNLPTVNATLRGICILMTRHLRTLNKAYHSVSTILVMGRRAGLQIQHRAPSLRLRSTVKRICPRRRVNFTVLSILTRVGGNGFLPIR